MEYVPALYLFETLICLSLSLSLTPSLTLRWVKQESELAKQEASQSSAPKLDLGFKEGQTIKISLGVRD